MVKSTFDIAERENRIINIVKCPHGFKNREQAIAFILRDYEESLEPEIRPGYIKKLKKLKRGKFHSFNSKKEFLHFLENEIWFFLWVKESHEKIKKEGFREL